MITPSPVNTAALLGLDGNGIMWCDDTLNPGLAGCAYASPACGTADRSSQCYAEATAAGIVRKGRSEKAAPGMRATADFYAQGLTEDGRWTGRIHVDPSRIAPAFDKLPKKASAKVRRVFVTSMSDLFHDDVSFDFLDRVFAEMRARPWIDFLVLTKRAENMATYAEAGFTRWPPNVWAGCTVEDQRRADERIPHLLRVPAAVRFLSVEPMLGAIDLTSIAWPIVDEPAHRVDVLRGGYWNAKGWAACGPAAQLGAARGGFTNHSNMPGWPSMIRWVIVGSESNGNAPGKRETRDEWVLDLVRQCDDAEVPVFVKQLSVGGKLCALPMVNGKVRAEFPAVSR